MDIPLRIAALGQNWARSFLLRPKLLPSYIENGRIVFPEKSYSSRNVKTGIGILPTSLDNPQRQCHNRL